VEKSCSENDVKKAYKKVSSSSLSFWMGCALIPLACTSFTSGQEVSSDLDLVLKVRADFYSGAPGADEAFKSELRRLYWES
jgi:hypothetical protein